MTRLEATDLHISLDGRPVIDGLDIHVDDGEMVGLLGPNASGKTTLLRALAGLIKPIAGTVTMNGAPLTALSDGDRARHVAYLEQGARSEWPVSVRRLVTLGRVPYLDRWAVPDAGDERAVSEAMMRCDIASLEDRPVTALSGGERARVMLARALAGNPALLLADEPVSQLDPFHQLQIMEVIRAQARDGCAALVVLHDLTLAAKFCDRLVLLRDGKVAAEGTPTAVLNDTVLARVFSISAAFLDDGDGILVVPRHRIGNGTEREP